MNEPTVEFTATERDTFLDCRHAWFWRYGLRFDAARPSKRALLIELWSAMMRAWWTAWTHSEANPFRRAESIVQKWAHDWRGRCIPSLFSTEDPMPLFRGDELDDIVETMSQMIRRYTAAYGPQSSGHGTRFGDESVPIATVRSVGQWLSYVPPRSPGRFRTRLDAVVEDPDGEIWILEHRIGSSLSGYSTRTAYRPDFGALGWLVAIQFMREPAGVITDFALRARRPRLDEFKTVQPRKKGAPRRLAHKVPSNCTADTARRAHFHHAVDQDLWWTERIAQMESEPSPFLRRFVYRFGEGEITRAQHELGALGHEIAGARALLRERGRSFEDRRAPNPEDSAIAKVLDFAIDSGHHFARNHRSCDFYGRRCPYLSACAQPTLEAVRDGLERRENRLPRGQK